jgi:tRNA threonylcarbamoyladenosine biosynthesis protein TsaE
MIWQTVSTSSAETERLGRLLGQNLKGGEVIELRADLGGGKTTFVRGLAAGAGSKSTVTSPTFTLSKVYPAKNFDIHHFDFYRLDDPGILRDQLAESVNEKSTVTVIEWADIVKDVLPKDHISIEFKPRANDPDERQISITYYEKARPLIAKVGTEWDEIEP